ncbi:MAG TPA: NTF2-like N-terminal transpeptidase domain-containing protein, partial [Nocardioides sp.]|nr:NTF2-like N-terminal transpeptidase domain-containing protein [Nocardioides sp.]
MSRTLPLAAALLVLTGCSSATDATGPDPADVAEQLAEGLASGDLASVPVAGPADADADYAEIVEGLGELAPTVSVEEVAEGDATATVTLGWSWPVSEQDWTYTSEATLDRQDDEWQVRWAPAVVEPSLGEGGVLELRTAAAPRADVLGAGGQRLVTERPVTRFGIDRSAVPPKQAVASARRLAALLDIDVAAYAEQVKAAGELAFVEGIVYRREEVPLRVGSSYDQIPGALAVQDTLALAPTREFAAPILGSVGPVTAEMVEEDPERYQPGVEAGLSGLQARYDEQLAGTPGVSVVAV